MIKNAVSPDSLLADLLAEMAEEVCGFQPADDEISEFIKSHHEKWLLSPESGQEVPTTNHPNSKTSRQTKNQTEKPKRMQIGKKNYALKYDHEIFVNTANWLIAKRNLKFSDSPLKVNPKAKLNYISNKIENDYPQDWTKLENGLYIYKNLQRNQSLQNAKRLLEHYGYDPEMLQIEYTDIPKSEDHRTSQKRATMQMLELSDIQHRAVILIVNRSWDEDDSSLYETIRFAWPFKKEKAEQVEVILASYNRMIVGAFMADEWLATTPENFPDRKTTPGRIGFIGHEASPEIQNFYVGKRVSDELRSYGSSFRFINC